MRNAAKALVHLLTVGVPAAVLAAPDGYTGTEVVSILVLLVGAAAVLVKKNTPAQPAARALAAGFTVVASTVTVAWGDYVITPQEWITTFLAVMGVLMAYLAGDDQTSEMVELVTTERTVPLDPDPNDVGRTRRDIGGIDGGVVGHA
jgi:hypothetical protein